MCDPAHVILAAVLSKLSTVMRYLKQVLAPMLDRIDIHIEVPHVDFEKLSDNRRGELSDKIRARGAGASHTLRDVAVYQG